MNWKLKTARLNLSFVKFKGEARLIVEPGTFWFESGKKSNPKVHSIYTSKAEFTRVLRSNRTNIISAETVKENRHKVIIINFK